MADSPSCLPSSLKKKSVGSVGMALALLATSCGQSLPEEFHDEYTETVRPAMVVIAEALDDLGLDASSANDLPTADQIRGGDRLFGSGFHVFFRVERPFHGETVYIADAIRDALHTAGFRPDVRPYTRDSSFSVPLEFHDLDDWTMRFYFQSLYDDSYVVVAASPGEV